jgi:hypothetical protein
VNVFPFIEAERAERHNVAKACELLEVSRSAFYEHAKHLPSARAVADAELAERIEAIHEASRGTYGWPRVHRDLRREGIHVSRKRVARIMRQRGPDRSVPTTLCRHHHLRSRHHGGRPAQALLWTRHRRAGPDLLRG